MSGPNSASCDGQLNCGSLHKQTRGNTLSGDVHTPVENHDLVPSFSHRIESQAHSRVSECDGRPTFQAESGAVDGMVTTSTGVQTDLPKVVHPPRGPICHSSEPQASTVRVSYPRPEGLGHRCSKHKLDGSHCLCLPSNGSPSQHDPQNQTIQLSDHTNSPRLARDALVWDLQRSHCNSRCPQHSSNSPTITCSTAIRNNWCLGVDSSKNKASLWRWQRELLHLSGHQQGPSTSQSGPYLKNGAESIRWISPLHL